MTINQSVISFESVSSCIKMESMIQTLTVLLLHIAIYKTFFKMCQDFKVIYKCIAYLNILTTHLFLKVPFYGVIKVLCKLSTQYLQCMICVNDYLFIGEEL